MPLLPTKLNSLIDLKPDHSQPNDDSMVRLGLRLYGCGAMLTLGVSSLILLTSMVKLTIGLVHYWLHSEEPDSFKHLLEPLELGFFGPLPFLIYTGACRVMVDMIPSKGKKWSSSRIKKKSDYNMEIIKGMVVALIIGVFATDLLQRALHEEGLSLQLAAAHCTVILVLTFFIWVIKPHRAHQHAGPPSPTQSSEDLVAMDAATTPSLPDASDATPDSSDHLVAVDAATTPSLPDESDATPDLATSAVKSAAGHSGLQSAEVS